MAESTVEVRRFFALTHALTAEGAWTRASYAQEVQFFKTHNLKHDKIKVPTTEWVVLTDEDPRRGGGALHVWMKTQGGGGGALWMKTQGGGGGASRTKTKEGGL